MNPIINLPIFLFQIIVIYFLSHQTTNELFYFFRRFIDNEKIIFSLVSLFYLPGTIIHELAHLLVAMVLMLKIRDIKIFPEFEKNYIKLGSVHYEKKDFIRGIIVGIAPFIVGIIFCLSLAYLKIFPSDNIFINTVFIYIIFTITSTMFSSKQDLVDLVYLIPLLIIVIGVIYIFNIRIDLFLQNKIFIERITYFTQSINMYFFLSIIINIMFIIIFRSLRVITKK